MHAAQPPLPPASRCRKGRGTERCRYAASLLLTGMLAQACTGTDPLAGYYPPPADPAVEQTPGPAPMQGPSRGAPGASPNSDPVADPAAGEPVADPPAGTTPVNPGGDPPVDAEPGDPGAGEPFDPEPETVPADPGVPTPDFVRIRSVATGACLRRSDNADVGQGFDVFQFDCEGDDDRLLWRRECSQSACKFLGASDGLCLKASQTFTASGGSDNAYAIPCGDDIDQTWNLQLESGDRFRLQSADTLACAHASQSEQTEQGHDQLVQRPCGDDDKQVFELLAGSEQTPDPEPEPEPEPGGSDGFAADWHVGTEVDYDGDGAIRVDRPGASQRGDLLLLFLSRTDDLLPLRLDGWTRAVECLKSDNGQRQCLREADCTERLDADYCRTFGDGGNGRDLAGALFYRFVAQNEPERFAFDLRGDKPAWAILVAARGADPDDPIVDTAGRSRDSSDDSVFPSVRAESGSLLLVSQSFDDTAAVDQFTAPGGMDAVGHVAGNDEAGFVFGERIASSGETGDRTSRGPGGPAAKDLMLSVTLRAR